MSWRTTLRPLDTKFHGLSKLLCDYGVDGANKMQVVTGPS